MFLITLSSNKAKNDFEKDADFTFTVFAQYAPSHIPKFRIDALEEEMQHPIGAPVVKAPKMHLKGVLVSKECCVMLEVKDAKGQRSFTFHRKSRPVSDLTHLPTGMLMRSRLVLPTCFFEPPFKAEGIFRCFFPWTKEVSKREHKTAAIMHAHGIEQEVSEGENDTVEATNSKVDEKNGGDTATKNIPCDPSKRRFSHQTHVLSGAQFTKLAKQFGDAISEHELCVAALDACEVEGAEGEERNRGACRKEKMKEEKGKEEKETKEKEMADNKESVTYEDENGKKAKKEKWVSDEKEKDSKNSNVDATPATKEKEAEVQATQSVKASE
ncbi:hypothetical protein CYLTODRAFT_457760 [Cylindrobasidium torrendii FP15055 ss-10]|uniref:Uncharacterized protein n=1 Tax=Cylindrobasidium torrendii FP15055 ss-10 TaxID=1314674 RepID=A0A0D7B2T2_9AGAR|nr:hypothetical protein CYLTODRAFT_457760 [Cylindrobasidium torrendii FP15055 ss-10]